MSETIAERVKAARLAAKLSQYQLAQKIGVSDAYISQIETGLRIPSIALQVKMEMIIKGFKATCPACGADIK